MESFLLGMEAFFLSPEGTTICGIAVAIVVFIYHSMNSGGYLRNSAKELTRDWLVVLLVYFVLMWHNYPILMPFLIMNQLFVAVICLVLDIYVDSREARLIKASLASGEHRGLVEAFDQRIYPSKMFADIVIGFGEFLLLCGMVAVGILVMIPFFGLLGNVSWMIHFLMMLSLFVIAKVNRENVVEP